MLGALGSTRSRRRRLDKANRHDEEALTTSRAALPQTILLRVHEDYEWVFSGDAESKSLKTSGGSEKMSGESGSARRTYPLSTPHPRLAARVGRHRAADNWKHPRLHAGPDHAALCSPARRSLSRQARTVRQCIASEAPKINCILSVDLVSQPNE